MFEKPDNWHGLGPDDKIRLRLEQWSDGRGIPFADAACADAYRRRARCIRDAVLITGQSRPPAAPVVGSYLVKRAGLNGLDVLYHHEQVVQPILDFHREFQPDVLINTGPMPGRAWDILEYRVYVWAGHGLPDNQIFQTVDGEYMTADEYPALIRDPSGFWIRHYLPRAFGALEPMRQMANLPTLTELPSMGPAMLPFARPEVRAMLDKLVQAGEVAAQTLAIAQRIGGSLLACGFPSLIGPPFCKAPFDMIGDTMRGTQGIMTDMYRHPAEVIAACEALVPIVIQDILEACDRLGSVFVTFPLHKGADAFMSDKQFRQFYWPTLRAVIEALNAEGLVPLLFAEGSYNKRLEIIADYPPRRCIWFFDQSDMHRVRETLGGSMCVQGNIPSSLMAVGTPERLRAYCKDLLELFADCGGFILANGAGVDTTTDEHVRTVIEVVR